MITKLSEKNVTIISAGFYWNQFQIIYVFRNFLKFTHNFYEQNLTNYSRIRLKDVLRSQRPATFIEHQLNAVIHHG